MYCQDCGHKLVALRCQYYKTDCTLYGCSSCDRLWTTHQGGDCKKSGGSYALEIIKLKKDCADKSRDTSFFNSPVCSSIPKEEPS